MSEKNSEYDVNSLPILLKHIYQEKLGVKVSVDDILLKKPQSLTENEIFHTLKFYKGGFSDNIINNPQVRESLMENGFYLGGYFNTGFSKFRNSKIDTFLEKLLLNLNVSIDDLVLFLLSKNCRCLIEEIESKSFEKQKEFILKKLSEILNDIENLKEEKTRN